MEALDIVAKQLGNTRTVCRKYYVHPSILDLYSDRTLEKYFKEIDSVECKPDETGLTHEEQVLMKILDTHGQTVTIQG